MALLQSGEQGFHERCVLLRKDGAQIEQYMIVLNPGDHGDARRASAKARFQLRR